MDGSKLNGWKSTCLLEEIYNYTRRWVGLNESLSAFLLVFSRLIYKVGFGSFPKKFIQRRREEAPPIVARSEAINSRGHPGQSTKDSTIKLNRLTVSY